MGTKLVSLVSETQHHRKSYLLLVKKSTLICYCKTLIFVKIFHAGFVSLISMKSGDPNLKHVFYNKPITDILFVFVFTNNSRISNF